MIVSLNLIKRFADIKLSDEEIVERIGARLGEVDSVKKLADKYSGLMVAEVVEAKRHPDADKLGVYKISNGKDVVQVVVGDKTLKVGDKVAHIAPGLRVPSTFYDDEPFVLKRLKLRGVTSNGMLGSASELGFSDEHKGVLKLDTDAKPGTSLIKAYQLDDVIIELNNKSFTNRADCFGIIGFAREVAGIQNIQFDTPDWLLKGGSTKASDDGVKVKNQVEEDVPTYLLQLIKSVKDGKSPILMQTYLSRVGIKPISATVDVTNYVMLMTGQPLHVFDADKIKGAVSVRHAKKGEKMTLLDDNKIEFVGGEILICDESGPIALAGVMGGKTTEVSSLTKNVLLESANFNMYSIRRTSMQHGIFSDAVTRFSRGQSPMLPSYALKQASEMLVKTVGGEIVTKQVGNLARFKPKKVVASIKKMSAILGKDIETSKVSMLLASVGLENDITNEKISVTVPYWRNDLNIEEDIVEEIGRLGGYDHIKPTLPKRPTKAYAINETQRVKSKIKNAIIATGANEVLSYSGVSSKVADWTGWDVKGLYHIANSRSPELEYMRPALVASLLEKVHKNHKAGYVEFGLFEINPVHSKMAVENGLPIESNRMGFVYSKQTESSGAPYFVAKTYLEETLKALNITNIEYRQFKPTMLDEFTPAVFDLGRSAAIFYGTKCLGVVGEFNSEVSKNYKLRQNCAGFEVFIDELHVQESRYKRLNKYPAVSRDVTYEVSNATSFYDVESTIKKLLDSDKAAEYSLEAGDIFRGEGKRRITFALRLWSSKKTLTSKQVNKAVESLAKHLDTTISAKQI